MCNTCGKCTESSPPFLKPQADFDQHLQALLKGLTQCSIQNLTINSYGPLTIFSDKPHMCSEPNAAAAISQPNGTKGKDPVTPQWSWETGNIRLRNELEGSIRRVTVFHKRSYTAPVITSKTWEDLNPGSTTNGFRTEFQAGRSCGFVVKYRTELT